MSVKEEFILILDTLIYGQNTRPMNNMENIEISYKALSNDEGSASTAIPKNGKSYSAGGWASSRNPAVALGI